jgi:hypothetical protein
MERFIWKNAWPAAAGLLGVVLLAGCSPEADGPPSQADPEGDQQVEQQAQDEQQGEEGSEPAQPEVGGETDEASSAPSEANPSDEPPMPDPGKAGPDDDRPDTDAQPDGQQQGADDPDADPAQVDIPKPEVPDLGEPMVDNPDQLRRLHEELPVWIDPTGKRIIMQGQVVQREVPLEMFACLFHTKEHESIVAVPTQAYIVHAGLLAVGAVMGRPVQFNPKYIPATGQEIEVLVRYKNAEGEVQQATAQEWIRNVETGEAMDLPFVFAGSGFWMDEDSGQRRYLAEGGDFICVSNFPSATLDLPIKSSQANSQLLFEAYTERIPPIGTPVTVILKPVPGTGPDVGKLIEPAEQAEQPADDAEPPAQSQPPALPESNPTAEPSAK